MVAATFEEKTYETAYNIELAAGRGGNLRIFSPGQVLEKLTGFDAAADPGQRVRAVGDVFHMRLTKDGAVRENHIVEFEEGRRIAWRPSEPGATPPGHLWRWELEPLGEDRTRVTHTYDWSRLNDEKRLTRARNTTSDKLAVSLERLAALAEG